MIRCILCYWQGFLFQFTRREVEVLDVCVDYMWVDFCISTCYWVGHCMLTRKEN